MNPGTSSDQSFSYEEPGYATKVTLEIMVASIDMPIAQNGTVRLK